MVPELERLSAVTREYARFSRSAAGLGSVLGGVFGLVSYFAGALAPLTWWSRAALAALPLVWIVAKELLQRRYYQRHGRVEEVERAGERRLHRFLTATIAVVSIAVVGWLLRDVIVHGRGDREWWELAGYLAFVAAMPFLVWRYLRTPLEFIVGVFLLAQAAVVLGGGRYELGEQLQAPIASLVLIGLGAWEHWSYRKLERRLGEVGRVGT
jgi:hypothetical protein